MTAAKSERDKATLSAQVEAADQCAENTDRELYREPDKGHGSYYSDSIHVTQRGGIGINCSGTVIVKPLREWHKLAAAQAPGQQASAVGEEEKIEQAFKEILKVWRAQRSTLPMPQIEWAELAARAVLALIQRSYSGGGEAAPAQQTPEGWRDIASAPKDFAILTYDFGFEVAHYNTTLKRWAVCWDHREIKQPLFWQPLPEHPSKQDILDADEKRSASPPPPPASTEESK